MENTETYLVKAWGESLDNVTIDDVKQAIEETIKMDDEHGAFWVVIGEENEVVLETHKDLAVIGVFTDKPEEQIKAQFENWIDIERLYELFLVQDFDAVKLALASNSLFDA